MTDDAITINQVEDLKDFKQYSPDNWKWRYWNDELDNSLEKSKDYFKRAEIAKCIYQGKTYAMEDAQGTNKKRKPVYNILYSNIETLKPLIFSRLPNPQVRKRNLEKNNVNKLISILLERNIKRILEEADGQRIIEQARDDFLIAKRGVIKVLYEQEILETEEQIETPIVDEATGEMTGLDVQTIVNEEPGEKKISLEYVNYEDIIFSCAGKWEKVDWVAFRHYFTKEELRKRFGRKGNLINLDDALDRNSIKDESEDKDGVFKKAEVWEIWDKKDKKVCFWSKGYDKGLIKEIDDNYNLINFFNIPRPLGIESGVDNVNEPIPDYYYYEEQAKELDRISNRILAILPYVSVGGGFNSALKQDTATNFMQSIEQYVPVDLPLDADIRTMIYERDIVKLTSVLQVLYEERQQTIRAIQEITGISDIVRGQTVAAETATAQELKGNFAVSRLQPSQKEVEFFCRDLIRIVAELLSEKFDIVELAKAAQIKVFDMDALTKQFTDELEQQGLPQQEFMQALMIKLKPYQNEIKSGQATTINNLKEAQKIMKSDKLRGWAIEVETDSTIKVDQNAEKEAVVEFANAIATVSQQFLPLVEAGVFSKEAFKSLLSYIMRRFEGSEEVEELLDDEDTQQENPAEQMQQQAIQQEMERENKKVEIDAFKAETDAQYKSRELDIREGEAILGAENFSDDMKIRQQAIANKVNNANG
jgi:hypothetical protein